MTSDRNQPTPRPWYRRFRGNLRSNTKLTSVPSEAGLASGGTATSWAGEQFFPVRQLLVDVRRGTNAMRRRHGDARLRTRGEDSSGFINDLHVWFRSFRVKLSRMSICCQLRKEKASAVSRRIQRN